MRAFLLSFFLLVCGTGLVFGEAVLPQSTPPPRPNEVIDFLSAMGFSPEFTGAVAAALTAGFNSGRATTTVTLLFLQDLAKIPREQAERGLEIIRFALSQGFIVDTGFAGSSMMNEARKLLALGRSWEEVERVLSLRLGFLLATRSVLARYAVISLSAIGPDVPLAASDRLVLELAWAVGDFILWEGGTLGDPRFLGYVQGRLDRLASVGVLSSALTGRTVAVLTPSILEEIVRLAFQPERR
ncbi:MAG: hypothetical protein NZ651_03505 [Candidatus Bipolaricaulota bacterium]|nr:hypothetical protein [Candidatus Bipolaricaulota bacterium]MDW8126821.1 hypothetical protein [Candidatus Bipolaricaulota bacterium]